MRLTLFLLAIAGSTAVAQPVMHPDEGGPPSLCPPSPPPPPPPSIAAPANLTEEPQQWLVLGAVSDQRGTLVGGHVALDAFTHGAWSLGLAGTYRDGGTAATARSNATVFLAATTAVGPLLLRARLGAGMAFVDGGTTVNSSAMSIGGTTTSPIGEAALLAALPLGRDWLVVGGPVVDAAKDAATEVSLLAGLGRRF